MDMGLEPVSQSGLSGSVKAILVIQTLGLAGLVFWLGKEYQNNIYLQPYVRTTAWTYLPVLAFIATFTIAVGASEAYSRIGARNLGAQPVEPSTSQGLVLTGGFASAQSELGQENKSGTADERASETVDWVPPGVSFAKVFDESRLPVVLKRVENDQALATYAPPAYPVIKRLKPARDPVEKEPTKAVPRPLNRVGMAPGFAIPPPPVIRQINRPSGAGMRKDDSPRNDPATPSEDGLKENTRSLKPRPAKKKPSIDEGLENDFSGE